MLIPEKVREVTTSGVTESSAFEISFKDQGHIKSILRDNIYSDKPLAILREYSANAWDAHRMVGKDDLPIEVTIPTYDNLNFIVKDYGPGLSHEDVFGVFTQYGASTKRGTNKAVGMLGIGSKSGFCYSDTFTIVSRHGGKARTYVAMLDEADNDALSLLNEEDCGDDTGLTIQIAVKKEDIYRFETKARSLFQHFVPRPKINITLPPIPAIRSKLIHGIIFDQRIEEYQGSHWFALMGCVPYKIDLTQLTGPDGVTPLISESFKKASGLLQFDIGDIQVNASREGLKYSNITKDALVKKFSALLDEYLIVVLDEIEKGDGTDWEKRIKAQSLLNLGLGKDEVGDWGLETVEMDPETFRVRPQSIPIEERIELVRMTEIGKKQKEKYFNLEWRRHIRIERLPVMDMTNPKDPQPVFESPGIQKLYTWDEVNAELDAQIKKHKLTGIKILNLHEMPYQNPRSLSMSGTPKVVNRKHTAKMFRLLHTDYVGSRHQSDRWEIVDRVATPDDTFVILDHFHPLGISETHLLGSRKEDAQIAKFFGIVLPDIYGYKTTEKKPLVPGKITGLPYLEWRKKWISELPADKLKNFVDEQAWIHQARELSIFPDAIGTMRKGLNITHPFIEHCLKALKIKKTVSENEGMLRILFNTGAVVASKTEPGLEFEAFCQKYPLLAAHSFSGLWHRTMAPHWQQYMLFIDSLVPAVPAVVVSEPVAEVIPTPEIVPEVPSTTIADEIVLDSAEEALAP